MELESVKTNMSQKEFFATLTLLGFSEQIAHTNKNYFTGWCFRYQQNGLLIFYYVKDTYLTVRQKGHLVFQWHEPKYSRMIEEIKEVIKTDGHSKTVCEHSAYA